jgi:hypothetical protein
MSKKGEGERDGCESEFVICSWKNFHAKNAKGKERKEE